MGVETLIRDRFTAAREYAAADAAARKAALERDAGAVLASGGGLPAVGALFTPPPAFHRDLELEALAEVLAGTRLVHCHSYRQDEILMLCNVSRDFNFRIGTFQHILEGYKVADHVRDRSGGGSGFSDWWGYKVEVQDAIPGGLPLMHDVGCVVSFNSDSDELARRLNVEAGKAVKYGRIPEEEALKFVTLNPARQLHIDHRVGSLEVGKDADVAVWNGPPMSAMSKCEMTFVDGRLLFSIEQDAKARAWIAAERERLIQKTLADAKRPARDANADSDRPGPGGPGGPGGRRGRFRPPQDQAQTDEQIEVLRQYYLDLMNRGKTPNEPGVCGCGLLHEW
jgi:N-acetylglucosamine-6-phosphate deacetylase